MVGKHKSKTLRERTLDEAEHLEACIGGMAILAMLLLLGTLLHPIAT